MINGYPHGRGGLFEVACRVAEKALSRPVRSHLVSLGGFPAPRAAKHLKQRVFAFDPDYIVIQFGATDAQCPIRARNRGDSLSSKSSLCLKDAKNHGRPATVVSALRWEIASLI